MSTGKRIRQIRKDFHINQYQLAEKTGCLNQSQISKIEKGIRKVTDTDLINIAKALGVSVEVLLSDKETSATNQNKDAI